MHLVDFKSAHFFGANHSSLYLREKSGRVIILLPYKSGGLRMENREKGSERAFRKLRMKDWGRKGSREIDDYIWRNGREIGE